MMTLTASRPTTSVQQLALIALLSIPALTLTLTDTAFAQGRNYDISRDRNESFQPREAEQPRQLTRREQVCQYYERRLAANWVQGRQPNYDLPRLQEQIQKVDARYNALRAQADRHRCYTSFLIFGTQLRNTRRCHGIDRRLKKAESQLEQLQRKRRAVSRPRTDNGRRAQIIQKLAQHRCGAQYQREAKRYSFFWWGDDDVYEDNNRGYGSSGISPYATYRTMCVRLCDGYYFPVSFSTLSSRFPHDEVTCQQKCAAPAQLFVYRNPGENIEQMTSWESGTSYQSLDNAFRYRKEFVKGCSCKPSEYLAEGNRPDAAETATTGTDVSQNSGSRPPGVSSSRAAEERRTKTSELSPEN